MRITVDSAALAALISYADDKRVSSDSEFLCSWEHEGSQHEFDELVNALEISDE